MNKAKKILSNAEIIGLSLFFSEEKILVITDLHLGFEEALIKQGILIPIFNFLDSVKKLTGIFSKTGKLEKIIILGDLKHEFGVISEQEWNEVIKMLVFLGEHSKEIILLKGNHDNILGPIAKWKNLSLEESFFLEEKKILFLHGDKIPLTKEFKEAKTIIIGHEHPAIVLRDGIKTEKFKCFLKGSFGRKTLIVLPSFNSTAEGTDVLRKKLLSPFLHQDLNKFEVWVIADKTYFFGKISELDNSLLPEWF